MSGLVLVTGGCGFLGSQVVEQLAARGEKAVVLDSLTYAGAIKNAPGALRIEVADICDKSRLRQIFGHDQFAAVIHCAAETHVDRSFAYPDGFIRSNVQGTLALLEALVEHAAHYGAAPRLIHVSTDEVYGSVEDAVDERALVRPGNPYAASKLAAEALVQAYVNTYAIDAVIARFSNFYGPRQYPEKLIPITLRRLLAGRPAEIHGDGLQIRQWLHVEDAARAIAALRASGRRGEIYNFPGEAQEILVLVRSLIALLGRGCLEHVEDRPGNDRRYCMDGGKARRELSWSPVIPFERGLEQTIASYCQAHDARGAR